MKSERESEKYRHQERLSRINKQIKADGDATETLGSLTSEVPRLVNLPMYERIGAKRLELVFFFFCVCAEIHCKDYVTKTIISKSVHYFDGECVGTLTHSEVYS